MAPCARGCHETGSTGALFSFLRLDGKKAYEQFFPSVEITLRGAFRSIEMTRANADYLRHIDARSNKVVNINTSLYRNYGACLFVALGCTGVTGCANSITHQNAMAQHWKTGRVHAIVQGKNLKNIPERECVAVLTTEEIERSRFAVVRYSRGRGAQNRTVRILDSSDIKVGDCVRIDLSDCGQTLEIQSSSGILDSCSW